jgi:hypothetical protein
MNTSAVYELRERLLAAAVAGAGLAPDDFRLKRAVEQMESLASASPVFRRITDMAGRVTARECPDRPGVLLDTLGLLDAVLRTQGSLVKDGEAEDLMPVKPEAGWGKIRTDLPYSRLAPLLDAMKGTGSGRTAVIRQTREQWPEMMEDYRVKKQMVRALADPYSELADMLEHWLEEDGPDVVPLLKDGFRPDGGKEMERRLRIMGAISGAEENRFFCQAVQDAQKDVKRTAVAMLRYSPDNTELLLDLIGSERGKICQAAKWALSFMDTEEAAEYWRKESKKNPKEALSLLEGTTCDYASDILAGMLKEHIRLERAGYPGMSREQRAEAESRGGQLMQSVKGKHSPEMCACYADIYRIWPEEAEDILLESILRERHPALLHLAEELYREGGDTFLAPAFLAALVSEEPASVYERFSSYFEEGSVWKRLTGQDRKPGGILRVLERMRAEEGAGELGFSCCLPAGAAEGPLRWEWIPVVLDDRWYPLLMRYPGRKAALPDTGRAGNGKNERYDRLVAGLYRPGNRQLDTLYGRYFYGRALARGTRLMDIRILLACGWENFSGLIERAEEGGKPLPTWVLRQILDQIPLSNIEKGGELSRLLERQKGKAVNGVGILEKWRDNLLQGHSPDAR